MALARAIAAAGQEEEDALVAGTGRIWVRSSLNDAVAQRLHSCTQKTTTVVDLAEELQVFPSDIRSCLDKDVIVLEGKVYLESRLREAIKSTCRTMMKVQGFIDFAQLIRTLETDQGVFISLDFIKETLRDDEPVVTRQEFEHRKDRERLLDELKRAKEDPVAIPAELRAWAAEAIKADPELRQGQLINLGTEFEPVSLRERRRELAEATLERENRVTADQVRYLTPSVAETLIRLTPTVCCTRDFVEPLRGLIEAELAEENACVAVTECYSLFDSEEIASAALQFVLKASEDKESHSSYVEVEFPSVLLSSDSDNRMERVIVKRQTIEDVLRGRKRPEDVSKHPGLVGYLSQLLRQKETKEEKTITTTTSADDLGSKSKAELHSEFTESLWPMLDAIVTGYAKLKRTSLGPILIESLRTSRVRIRTMAILEALLRKDLQLSSSEDIPQDALREIQAIESDDPEQFRIALQRVCSQSFGLSCLSIDKKREKDLIARVRKQWLDEAVNPSSSRTPSACLCGLTVLQAYKVIVFIDERLAGEAWEAIQLQMVEIPPELNRLLSSGGDFAVGEVESLLSKCTKKTTSKKA